MYGAATGLWLALALAGAPVPSRAQAATLVASYQVTNDGIAQPLTTQAGDAARGRALVASRQQGLCLLCHSGPFPEERFQGNLAPDLSGAGARNTAAQLRLRLVDSTRVNPDTIMPAYHRADGLTRVATAWQGKAIFTAQQVEDVLAFLVTLR